LIVEEPDLALAMMVRSPIAKSYTASLSYTNLIETRKLTEQTSLEGVGLTPVRAGRLEAARSVSGGCPSSRPDVPKMGAKVALL